MGRSDGPNTLDLVDGRPAPVDEPLGQLLDHERRPAVDDVAVLLPSRVETQAFFQLLELPRVRVDRGLVAALDGLRLLPVRLLLEPGMKSTADM